MFIHNLHRKYSGYYRILRSTSLTLLSTDVIILEVDLIYTKSNFLSLNLLIPGTRGHEKETPGGAENVAPEVGLAD